ncbi:MAG TPA: hypothetical protein ENH06_01630 [bacterium]|nr:hypothetical protein [bacterium]
MKKKIIFIGIFVLFVITGFSQIYYADYNIDKVSINFKESYNPPIAIEISSMGRGIYEILFIDGDPPFSFIEIKYKRMISSTNKYEYEVISTTNSRLVSIDGYVISNEKLSFVSKGKSINYISISSNARELEFDLGDLIAKGVIK